MSSLEEFQQLEKHIRGLIIGQSHLINRMLIALLCDGHLLVEGAPGSRQDARYQGARREYRGRLSPLAIHARPAARRPDRHRYLPAAGRDFRVPQGPLFHNLILADEINRAPAKVQSALLEAMEERQITVGDEDLPSPTVSWSWRRKIRLSRKARIRCRKRSSIVFSCTWSLATRIATRNGAYSFSIAMKPARGGRTVPARAAS